MTRAAAPCRVVIDRLSRYLDGELGASACAAITRHARSCARCASIVGALRATTGICRAAGAAALPPGVRARARAQVDVLLSRASRGATRSVRATGATLPSSRTRRR